MKIGIKIILISVLSAVYGLCSAQNVYTKTDSIIYSKYMAEFAKYKNKPLPELIVLTGKHFMGKPYTGATLEDNEKEQLVINLREFDCTTFVESNVALSKEVKKGTNASFKGYIETLKNMRYRNGEINGYPSRIHYSSDWVYENLDLFDNITLKLGGSIVDKPLSFMSSNSHLYSSLKNSKANTEAIKLTEKAINKRNNYTIIPTAKIKQAAKDIKTGDIIIFGTNVHGLDYSHIGIAVWEGKVLKLLHASSVRKRVVIDTKDLVQYAITGKSRTGITVLRLKENQ